MANTDRARKLFVRSALITSTTIATLVGAQNFALLDAQNFQNDNTSENINLNTSSISKAEPEIQIISAAPRITVLRQSGTVNTNQATNPLPIQPPVSEQISVPSPVIQQPVPVIRQPAVVVAQPRAQRSRSSR